MRPLSRRAGVLERRMRSPRIEQQGKPDVMTSMSPTPSRPGDDRADSPNSLMMTSVRERDRAAGGSQARFRRLETGDDRQRKAAAAACPAFVSWRARWGVIARESRTRHEGPLSAWRRDPGLALLACPRSCSLVGFCASFVAGLACWRLSVAVLAGSVFFSRSLSFRSLCSFRDLVFSEPLTFLRRGSFSCLPLAVLAFFGEAAILAAIGSDSACAA